MGATEVKWETEQGDFCLSSTGEDWLLEAPSSLQLRLDDESLAALQKGLRKALSRQRSPRAGTPWTADEDDQLRSGFAEGHEAHELGAAHGRTRGAILARLAALGLIDPSKGGRFRS